MGCYSDRLNPNRVKKGGSYLCSSKGNFDLVVGKSKMLEHSQPTPLIVFKVALRT